MTKNSSDRVCQLGHSKTSCYRKLKAERSQGSILTICTSPGDICKRQEIMMAIARIIPVAKWLAKIKQRSDVGCRLCQKVREQRGVGTEILRKETYRHINSDFCDRIATTITATHHSFIWRHLYASMQAAQTPTSNLRFVTPDVESSTHLVAREID